MERKAKLRQSPIRPIAYSTKGRDSQRSKRPKRVFGSTRSALVAQELALNEGLQKGGRL